MSDSGAADPLMAAAVRLESAVERLATALSRPRTDEDAVPRADVAALSARLEATMARLKTALRDQIAPADDSAGDDRLGDDGGVDEGEE